MSAKNLFELAPDGWVQLSPCGEFAHKGAGVTQVLDRASFDAIKAAFDEDSRAENFPGVLVDFDHFSLDTDKPSEAAGWITALDSRGDGLWAQVRWSDSGLAAVTGGRFRLASPVFPPPDQCEDLGGGRIRPGRLLSVALTNEPNIKGSRPIANRRTEVGDQRSEARGRAEPNPPSHGKATAAEGKGNALGGPGSKRFMWILGPVEKGPHCAVCLSRNGKVKTLLEWLRAGAPKCRCKCRLAEVGVEVDEDYVPPVPEPTANRGALSNTGWTDEARAASLAVRRANAADRSPSGTGDGKSVTGFSQKYGWLMKDASGWEAYSRIRKEGDTVESMYGFKQVGKDLYIRFNGKWELAGSTDVAGINAFGGLEQNPELGANMRIDGKDALVSGKLYRDPMGGRWWMKVGDDWRDLSTGVLMADTFGGGWDLNNRWTDAARAARKTFHGWSDEARTAALEARRAKAKGGGAGPDDPEAVAEEADGFAAAFIRRYEGFSENAYPDPATGGAPWTVGFGSTRGLDGRPVRKGDHVTQEEANELLLRDMYGEAKKLSEKVPWAGLTPRQRAALMSWAYNVGGTAAAGSTLARRLAAGEDPAAVIREELPRWNRAGGRVMRGLTARRRAEVDLASGAGLNNRWTDAARAARKNFPGWSDEARAAAAAARAAKRAELREKVGGGTASPFERLQAVLDKPFEDDEKRAPAGYDGPVLSAGAVKEEESPDALYAEVGTPSLRDIVGAGPETGNTFLDSVTAGIGAVTLVGGVAAGGGGRGRNTFSAVTKSIARKAAREAVLARSRGTAPAVPEPPARSSSGLTSRVCGYLKEGVNASRALITSYDLSAVLRQGGILSVSNPSKVPAAMVSMFRSLFSGKTAERVDAELRARPGAALYRHSGLYLSDGPSGAMTAREEAFCSEVAKRIPGVAASERAFSSYLNRIRADCFDAMTGSLCRGHTPTSGELRAIANYINVATGRGNLGAFEKHSGALSTVFFAPKLAVSRFEFLFGMPLTAGSGRTRGVIAEQYARYLVGLGVVYGLSRMAGAEVGDDPTSSDAGKIRVGEKTRNDILSGLGQSLVFVSRMAGGVYTTASGKAVDITGPAGKVTEADVAWRFVRTKLSPLFSANVNLVTGRDVVGEPVTPKDAALDLVVPLVARDVAELYREHQVPTATAEALLSILGAGVAVYRSGRRRDAREEPVPTALDAAVSKRAALQAAVLEKERLAVAARRSAYASRKRGSGGAGKKGAGPKKVEEVAMGDVVEMKKIRRKAKKEKARVSGGTALVVNRWTDAARAARKTFHGWSDEARAAAAAARARRRAEAGGTYPDGRPAVPDVIGAFDGNTVDPSKSYLSTGDDLAERQARYSEAFRKWWSGVEATSENIAAFNAFVAAAGGAAAAGAGAYRQSSGMSPTEGISRVLGRAGRYATGKEPVYDEAGTLTGFARVGRRPYVRSDNAPLRAPYRRAGRLSADEGVADVVDPVTGTKTGSVRYDAPESVPEGFFKGMRGMGPDPFNNPSTPADRAFQASYGRWLDELDAGRDSAQAARELDPLGYATAASGRPSTGDAEADRVLAMLDRVKTIVPATEEEADAFGDVMEGLRAYGEMYEADRTERDPGLVDRIAEKLDALEKGGYGSLREVSPEYAGERLPVDDPDGPAPFAHPEAAAEAARALGVLHGSYGAGPEAADRIPEALLEDYVRGLEEGSQGYEYGVAAPADRSGVLRRARAFADGRLGDINDGYEADHIDDKYNARKFADPAAWAARNNPDGAVYDPAQPDTRSQYSPQALMEAALSWFSDAMVAGDRRASNAALAYMSDLMLGFAGDKAGVYRETLGDGDEDDAEVDTRVPLFDGDGNEIEGDSPFYEDSYADPNARMPWEDALPFELRNRLFEVYPPLAPLPVLANARWSDAYRARVAARRAATAARVAAKKASRPYAAMRILFDRAVRADNRAIARNLKAAKYAAQLRYNSAMRAAKKYSSEEDRSRAEAYARMDFEQACADADNEAAGQAASQWNRIQNGANENGLNLNFRGLAYKAWKAEMARVASQYAYEKMVAEQDGGTVPAAPAMPAVFGGIDFSQGLTPDMFDSDEEFQRAMEEWNAMYGAPGDPASGSDETPETPETPEPPEVSSGGRGGASTPPSRTGDPEPPEGSAPGGGETPPADPPPTDDEGADVPQAADDGTAPAEGEATEEDEEEKKKRAAADSAQANRRRGCLENTGWTDAARAASLAVRRAKAEARAGGKAPKDMSGRELVAAGFKAEQVPAQGDNGFAPLSEYDALIAQAEAAGDRRKARRLRGERNAARKAESRSARAAEKGVRSSPAAGSVAGAFSGEGPYAAAKAKAGFGESASAKLAASGGHPYEEAREARAEKGASRVPRAEAPVSLGGTPVFGAVFYTGDGRLYDRSGNDVGPAPKAVKDGAVFYRGRWFDAKTGRAVAAGPVS